MENKDPYHYNTKPNNVMLHFTQFVIKSKWNICGILKLL